MIKFKLNRKVKCHKKEYNGILFGFKKKKSFSNVYI